MHRNPPFLMGTLTLTLVMVVCVCASLSSWSAPVTLYETQFESAEGFDINFDLTGQNAWTNEGAGGNGLTNRLPAPPYEQSAYIGAVRTNLNVNGLFLWQPINHNPTNLPVVTVKFDMSVIDSTTTNRDEFRWNVYNIAGFRLFSLIFNNRDLRIYHQRDDDDHDQYRFNGWGFNNDDIYTVELVMNFAANRWSVWVGDTQKVQIITNELITATYASLTFGDADAVWVPAKPGNAGDNFMVFDNLLITADVVPQLAATLDSPLPIGGGQFLIRVNGTEGTKYAVEASTDLTDWVSLVTDSVGLNGYFYYLDTNSLGLPQRFYRARFVP